MIIKGHGKVSAIRLIHKGCDLKFDNILPVMYGEAVSIEPSDIMFWEFDDTLEIDAMIAMLNRFKKECAYRGFGRWREERE